MIRFLLYSFKKEKKLFLILSILFIAFVAIGMIVGSKATDKIEKIIGDVLSKKFEGILKNVSNNLELSLAILKNNMLVYLITIIAGTLTFGFMSLIVLISNGLIVGLVIPINLKKASLFKTLLLILPHGIIEISGFITGAVASMFLLKRFLKSKEKYDFKSDFKSFLALCVSGAILIIIAAFIEGYITASFAR